MDYKKIIPIIVIVALIAVVGGYFLLNNSSMDTTEHTTIVLSKSAYMEVPLDSNATSKADKKGIFYYKGSSDDINITSSSNLSAASSAKEMKKLKNSIATGSKKVNENGVVVYEKNGTYSIFVKNTQYNDTLLIQSSDKNLLLGCWQSIKYHDPTDNFKVDNTTSSGSGSSNVVDAVQQTQSAVQKSTSTSTSSSSSSSSSSGYGNSYSDFVSSSSSSKSSSSGSSKSSSYGDSYSDFV